MKKIVSSILACSLLCSNTVFAAEKNDIGTQPGVATTAATPAKSLKPTATVPKLTAQTAALYGLIPAGLSTVSFIGLGVVGIVAHNKDKKQNTAPAPRMNSPYSPPRTAPLYSPSPSPQPQTIKLTRELDNDPVVSYVQESTYRIH